MKLRDFFKGKDELIGQDSVEEKKTADKSEEKEKEKEKKSLKSKNDIVKNEDEPSQLEEIKDIIGHVVEPEDRTLNNYISPVFWKKTRDKYKKLREKEKEDLNVYGVLSDGARPSIEYYVLTILSCIIATIGLIQGSTAVIIGAMIIAPLMTPILAFSLGVIRGDIPLINTSLISILKGVFWALLISTAIAYIIPMPEYSEEIMARTRPNLFDIMVALASGIVGAYGYANKKISNTLVGIAIAVALMPPLCTIGIGLGTMNLKIASQATILFVINLVSISLSGAVIFWWMKITPILADQKEVKKRAVWQILISIAILTGIAIPVGFYMKEGYQISEAKKSAADTLKQEFPDHAIFRMETKKISGKLHVELVLTGEDIPNLDKMKELRKKFLNDYPVIDNIRITFIKKQIILIENEI